MAQNITSKKFAKNVIYSILAQIISLAVSFVLTLIVPKFIDEYQYSYWQTYVLYVGYVGVLHFGLLDGLVLRYSKFDYEELDKPRLRSQFIILLIFTGIITIAAASISLSVLDCCCGYNYKKYRNLQFVYVPDYEPHKQIRIFGNCAEAGLRRCCRPFTDT